VKSQLSHFQLRHLIKSINKNEILYMSDNSIWKWNRVSCHENEYGKNEKILSISEQSKIVSLTGNEHLIACGGMKGEVIIKSLKKDEILFENKLSEVDNAITNFIELNEKNNQLEVLISSNDDRMRVLNENFELIHDLKFEFCVNHATQSPLNEKLICISLDDVNIQIFDKSTGKSVCSLKGHTHFPFSGSWNPVKEYEVATGAQDQTTRIWDLRNCKNSHTLHGKISSVRGVEFNHDGSLLGVSEAADFVHLYDAANLYRNEQLIDIFGEISGISFSPKDESFFIGIYDQTYSSLLEFEKKTNQVLNKILI
jgi:WD40 repeat protein